MIENFWKDKYPAGIAAEINPDQYPNILSVLKESCQRFATKPAFTNLGKTLTYGELYKLSGDFAAYLQQHTDLKPGDRIAVQLPNVLQYPIVVFGAMRAGLIVVNTNPLYTARELEHQFNDSGAKAVVCLANMAHLVEGVLPKTGVKQVIVTEVGDILPPLKRFIVNFVVKHIKKMVPAYSLPQATKLTDALARGAGKSFQEAAPQADDVAVLQYTGGTTGVAKGAMLTHRNLVANMLQCKALMGANLNEGCEILIAPLPLYHIYAFTFHCMAMMLTGNHNILITNPRDLPSMLKDLGQWKFTGFVGLNTLFVALCNNETFRKLDFSALKLTLSGGMALQLATAELEGSHRLRHLRRLRHDRDRAGGIGQPVPEHPGRHHRYPGALDPVQGDWRRRPGSAPGRARRTLREGSAGDEGATGAPGGHRRDPRRRWLAEDRRYRDHQEDGYMRIVDRKKDMILVSGFNVSERTGRRAGDPAGRPAVRRRHPRRSPASRSRSSWWKPGRP